MPSIISENIVGIIFFGLLFFFFVVCPFLAYHSNKVDQELALLIEQEEEAAAEKERAEKAQAKLAEKAEASASPQSRNKASNQPKFDKKQPAAAKAVDDNFEAPPEVVNLSEFRQ